MNWLDRAMVAAIAVVLLGSLVGAIVAYVRQ